MKKKPTWGVVWLTGMFAVGFLMLFYWDQSHREARDKAAARDQAQIRIEAKVDRLIQLEDKR